MERKLEESKLSDLILQFNLNNINESKKSQIFIAIFLFTIFNILMIIKFIFGTKCTPNVHICLIFWLFYSWILWIRGEECTQFNRRLLYVWKLVNYILLTGLKRILRAHRTYTEVHRLQIYFKLMSMNIKKSSCVKI